MLTIYVCAVALLVVVLCGGRLRRLAQVRIRHVWLVWAALVDQVLVISVIPDSHRTLLALAHIASYVAAGACVVVNRHLAGVWLIAAGGATNGLVIALNGGTLPASAGALRASGWQPSPDHFNNSALLAHPRLHLLGDIFATPPWLPGHDVFSIGDIAICLGVLWFLWHTCITTRDTAPASGDAAPASGDTAPASGDTAQWRAEQGPRPGR
jgi:hypothetical protein